jgi:hypothetical protein
MLKSQNLFKVVPFSEAAQIYQQAYDLQLATELEAWQQRQQHEVDRLEQEWTAAHEAPAEFNFTDRLGEPPTPDFQQVAKRVAEKAVIDVWTLKYHKEILAAQPLIQQYISRLGVDALAMIEGQIDPKVTTQRIFNRFNHLDDRGLWIFTQLNSRSNWLPAQYKDPGRQWCSLVPLILYAFRLNHSIPYSRWSREGLGWAVHSNLYSAMLCEPPQLSREELLEIRSQGLRVKSGARTGDNRSPATTYRLYGVTHPEFRILPELAQVMLAQIWCAHPENRTKYMILDPKNWDQMPEPLITTDVFVTSGAKTKVAKKDDYVLDLPWNN